LKGTGDCKSRGDCESTGSTGDCENTGVEKIVRSRGKGSFYLDAAGRAGQEERKLSVIRYQFSYQ
jgi:hypothetical protein